MSRLIVFSGPSCVGKGPLVRTIVSYASRPGGLRPGERRDDYLATDEVRQLAGDPRYIVGECRGLPQAVDLSPFRERRPDDQAVYFIETYYTIAQQLLNNPSLQAMPGIEVTSFFLSPLSRKEIEALKTAGVDLPQHLTGLAMEKLLFRLRYFGKSETPAINGDLELRAQDAFFELKSAHLFGGVLVNHDGEGHPNWRMRPDGTLIDKNLGGDAARTVSAFADILRGRKVGFDSPWTAGLINT